MEAKSVVLRNAEAKTLSVSQRYSTGVVARRSSFKVQIAPPRLAAKSNPSSEKFGDRTSETIDLLPSFSFIAVHVSPPLR